ncbi:hypothetical protein Vadar_021192 [Vaccinium darrowii]|uniref:Uncharacterized protein n=1 Tax=Vaccinium darrowii TaxID=229202 RepID=A0ACB7Y9F2_9ERIC|nr:hypothetical protein Vadar_021192 [Vaccinium darrowii]
MALEAVEYPQDPFGYVEILDNLMHHGHNMDSSPEACNGGRFFGEEVTPVEAPVTEAVGRRKRRRTKSSKNKEEMESQRMTHIAVERNRRKQMNEYLAAVRSLMPASYVQRGDQASIIGGAINFLKELEHLLQTLGGSKDNNHPNNNRHRHRHPTMASRLRFSPTSSPSLSTQQIRVTVSKTAHRTSRGRWHTCLRLSVLHLNLTTVDHMVLYSLSVKVEDGSQLTTADEIADAVNHLLGKFEEEAAFI